ncbi:MAG TPA: SDR family oxidoreductase [Planctomycetota bacterium]|nr:SDR family oxidoreductase [Planctomycetota bacterium]
MTNSRTVLVTGGTGLIGGEVISTLLTRGWTVRATARGDSDEAAEKRILDRLSRSGQRGSDPRRLRCLSGSVTAPNLGLKTDAFDDVSVLLHCAGETAFNEDERCWKTNVGAAERLVELGRRLSKPPRIIFVSTASVLMSPRHAEITEDMPFGGYDNGYTRSKRKAEEILLASGLEVLILRPTIVFSRGVQDRKMARAMLWVIPALIELGSAPVEPDSRIDIIPVDYAADAIERMLHVSAPKHRCYHISAGSRSSVTCSEFQEAAARVDPRALEVNLSAAPSTRPGPAQNLLRRRLEDSISYYIPFMSADIVYSSDRLQAEIGQGLGHSPKVTQYVHTLLGQFEYQEGIQESARP